jgi:inner membrane protein
MLIFAHPGITLGAAAILAGNIDHQRNPVGWFASLSRYLDIRWLVIGSLLPDIIDKPVGEYWFKDTFNNGRIFSHSLLFLVLVAAAGFLLFRRKHYTWLLVLAAGTFTHLVLDEIWQTPQTFFWPLMGFTFPKENVEGWLSSIWQWLLHNPSVYVPEIIGLVIILLFCYTVIRNKKIGAFIKRGKVV